MNSLEEAIYLDGRTAEQRERRHSLATTRREGFVVKEVAQELFLSCFRVVGRHRCPIAVEGVVDPPLLVDLAMVGADPYPHSRGEEMSRNCLLVVTTSERKPADSHLENGKTIVVAAVVHPDLVDQEFSRDEISLTDVAEHRVAQVVAFHEERVALGISRQHHVRFGVSVEQVLQQRADEVEVGAVRRIIGCVAVFIEYVSCLLELSLAVDETVQFIDHLSIGFVHSIPPNSMDSHTILKNGKKVNALTESRKRYDRAIMSLVMSTEKNMEEIVSLAKRRGFIYPGSDVYGGLSGTWDYGPLGVALKRNIMQLWWKMFVDEREDMYGIDAAILMNQKVWQASGHVDTFTDPLVECSNCHGRFRADKLDDPNKCPSCSKEGTFGEARQFNMMFKTNVGPVDDEASISYLRPETAQGIFTNYKNVLDSFYPDLPFGLAQQGKAFRNEISPRDFIFRSREFEQMEIEYFVDPAKWEESFEHWRQQVWKWTQALGLPDDTVHELEVEEKDRAHYSKRTIDFEFDFPIGREELLGLAYRTDFDLGNIQRVSGKNVDYTIKGTNTKFVPHVIEPSFGVERALMAVLATAYTEDEVNGEKRIVMKFPEHLAPVRYAVSPLVRNKPELVAKAREVYAILKKKYGAVMWDDNGNIGKRYRRQDEIGTPHCVVIDFDTLEGDGTVTVRDRDTTEQKRVTIDEL